MMQKLEQLILSPDIAILILSVLALEAVFLTILWVRKNVGLPVGQIISFLGSGVAFSLALGGILSGSSAAIIGFCLGLAFVFHVLDLWQRWKA